jgi:hypothetical protein
MFTSATADARISDKYEADGLLSYTISPACRERLFAVVQREVAATSHDALRSGKDGALANAVQSIQGTWQVGGYVQDPDGELAGWWIAKRQRNGSAIVQVHSNVLDLAAGGLAKCQDGLVNCAKLVAMFLAQADDAEQAGDEVAKANAVQCADLMQGSVLQYEAAIAVASR